MNKKGKEKKNKYKINFKLLITSLIAILIIISFMYNIILLFVNPTNTFMVENGEISDSTETTGYLIREEKMFQGKNYKNGISQIKTEGQRVAKGDPIFRYYTNNEQNLIEDISKLDLQIQDALEQGSNIYSSDILSIDRQIENKLKKIISMNKISDINEYKKEINNALIKKAKLAGELSPSGSYINELILKRSKLEEKLNSGSEYIEATVSGIVSYRIDGLEEKLTPKNIENLTEKILEDINIKAGEIIASSNETGKIINNYNCYLATILKPEDAQYVEVNKKIKLILSTGDEIISNVEHVAKQESGNTLVIFKINECVEKLISYRKISFEIVWWNVNGLKVPNSSIIEKNGINYIIRKRAGYTDEIFVKVLKQAKNYSIIENYTSLELNELGYSTEEIRNKKNISLYDEILLKPPY